MIFTIFLDESGDLGFGDKQSSTHFCIALLVCKNRKTLLNIKSSIKNTFLRKFDPKKMKSKINELKGYNTKLAVKKHFYNQLLKAEDDAKQFEIYSLVIDKIKILPFIKDMQNMHRLYNIIAKDVLELIDFSDAKEVILFADSCKGSHERKIFDDYIRLHIEAKLPIKASLDITHDDSHETPGLQAVDLFCYGIVRKYAENDTLWYDFFSNRVLKDGLWKPKF